MKLTLTKDRFAEQIREKMDYSADRAKSIVEMILEEIKSSLESGDNVKISGFGRWAVKHKKARKGRNPHTGDPIEVTARTVVTFHPSDKLRNSVNAGFQ